MYKLCTNDKDGREQPRGVVVFLSNTRLAHIIRYSRLQNLGRGKGVRAEYPEKPTKFPQRLVPAVLPPSITNVPFMEWCHQSLHRAKASSFSTHQLSLPFRGGGFT